MLQSAVPISVPITVLCNINESDLFGLNSILTTLFYGPCGGHHHLHANGNPEAKIIKHSTISIPNCSCLSQSKET